MKVFVRGAVAELDKVFSNDAGCSFSDALLKDKSLGFERRKSSNEKRQQKRKL